MIDHPRTIALRRPPVLLRGSPLTADQMGHSIVEAESKWDALCSARPEYFDGGLLAVGGVARNGHGGVTLTVSPCPYRWYAVQDDTFDLGLRPLGVKALVRDPDGLLLCGQRASTVHAYPNRWEFLPGGSVEPEEDPLQTVVRELEEETGLVPQAPPVAKALCYDPPARTWEVVYELQVERAEGSPSQPGEHTACGWFTPSSLPCPMAPIAERLADLLIHEKGSTLGVDEGRFEQ